MSSKSKWGVALLGLWIAGVAVAEPPKEEVPAPKESKPVTRPVEVVPVENPALRPERMFWPALPKTKRIDDVKPAPKRAEEAKPAVERPPVANPALRPESMFHPVLPKAPAPKLPPAVAVPNAPPKVDLAALAKITDETNPFLQFNRIANLDVLYEPNKDVIRERIAALDPKLNKALLHGHNFELLGTSLFVDAIDGVFVARGDDGKTNVVIRFKDGSHHTIAGLDLTDAELGSVLRGSKPEKDFEEKLKLARGTGPAVPFQGPFARIEKRSELLALLGQFTIERQSGGLSGTADKPETLTYWDDSRARERRTPVAPLRAKAPAELGKSDAKDTHGPDKR